MEITGSIFSINISFEWLLVSDIYIIVSLHFSGTLKSRKCKNCILKEFVPPTGSLSSAWPSTAVYL